MVNHVSFCVHPPVLLFLHVFVTIGLKAAFAAKILTGKSGVSLLTGKRRKQLCIR